MDTFVTVEVTLAINFLGKRVSFGLLPTEHLPPAQVEELREFLADTRLKKGIILLPSAQRLGLGFFEVIGLGVWIGGNILYHQVYKKDGPPQRKDE